MNQTKAEYYVEENHSLNVQLEQAQRTIHSLNVQLTNKKLEIDRENFSRYFFQYDKRRNLNFVDVFPELADFYAENLPKGFNHG